LTITEKTPKKTKTCIFRCTSKSSFLSNFFAGQKL